MKKIILSTLIIGLTLTSLTAEVNLASCTGCHGQAFGKSALGKSKIVNDMNATDITTALLGYKDGTYGGPMKGLMKAQVSKYSDEELEKAAQEISIK